MFFSALDSSRIASGFLNRFLTINAEDTPRGDFQTPSRLPVPDEITTWAKTLLHPSGDLDLLHRAEAIPDARPLAITTDAAAAFQACRRDCNRWADDLEKENLGELPMRTTEQAMRLSLIAALSEDPHATRITTTHTAWGIAVAQESITRLVRDVHERMADNPLHALRNGFLRALRATEGRGMTQYEITRSRELAGVSMRDRDALIGWVVESGMAEWAVLPPVGAGRPRRALVPIGFAQIPTEGGDR
jgi:hypothetical protein